MKLDAVRKKSKLVENIVNNNVVTSIILLYYLVTVIVSVIFYPMVQMLLNYPPNNEEVSVRLGTSNIGQYIIIVFLSMLIGTFLFIRTFRGINNWDRLDPRKDEDLKELNAIRKKCINIPYLVFLGQALIVNIPLIPVLLFVRNLNNISLLAVIKVLIMVFSLMCLAAVISHTFSRRLFKIILLRTYTGGEKEGIRIGLKNKIFFQIIPMLILTMLFTALIGYSRLVDEKGDMLYSLYKMQLSESIDNMNTDLKNPEQAFNILKGIKFDSNEPIYFVKTPGSDIITSDNKNIGGYLTYFISNPYEGDRIFDINSETQGIVAAIDSNGSEWRIGVIFKVASGNVLMFFLLGFLALLFLNVFVLYYFSKSLAEEISLVAENLTEIAEGENVDLDRKLAVISNDELGDLVVAFNKIQQKEKEHICELEEKQAIIIEREQLAQDTLKKLKQLQTQLINQEKLAGIGQLAAGVAHEINTPLGYVSSNIETLKNYIMNYRTMLDIYRNFYKEVCKLYPDQSIPEMSTVYNTESKINIDFINSDITDLFIDVSDGLERISKIVMGLRTFSRVDQQNEFEEYDLNNGIQNTLLVANNEIKYHAKVELFLGDIPNIYANGGQINQVLLNIIINAVHATKSKEDINSSLITVRTYSDEHYASCEIEDNGTGIPENIVGRIFDPFYTTKPVGQGTGLGLSIAYDIIVNKHKGELLVDSKPDAGSKFTVRLPVHR